MRYRRSPVTMGRFMEMALLLVAFGTVDGATTIGTTTTSAPTTTSGTTTETTPCDRIDLMNSSENPSPTPTSSPVGNAGDTPLSQIHLDGSPFVDTVKVTSRTIFSSVSPVETTNPGETEFPVKPSTDEIILVTKDKPDRFTVNGTPVDISSSTPGTIDGNSVYLTTLPVTPSTNPVTVTIPLEKDKPEAFQKIEGTEDPEDPSFFEVPVNGPVSDILVPEISSVSEIVICRYETTGVAAKVLQDT